MADFVPSLNSSGTFLFKKPISDKVNTQTLFTCKSNRKISELLASGQNVFNDYYSKNSLSSDTYNIDKANDVTIVGLYSNSNSWLYVPASQILSYPDASGVPYRRKAFAVELGPVEDSYDLDSLQSTLGELIYTHLGIRPFIKVVSLSETAMIKQSEHESILNMRKGNVDVTKSLFVELETYKQLVKELTIKNGILEEHIIKGLTI